MPKTKIQKEALLNSLKEKLQNMKASVFVNFMGLDVKSTEELRGKCRENDAEYLVAKKTILKRALVESGYKEFEEKNFEGETAVVFGNGDEVSPARTVVEFSKDHEQIKVLAGILEGKVIEDTQIIALSKLPSRDELLAKAVGSIAAPLSGLVNVLHGNLKGLVYALSAIRDKKA